MQGAKRRSMGFRSGGVSLKSGLEEGEHGQRVFGGENGHGGMAFMAWL